MKILQYHMGCDGALGLERSISGIVHMFAGACINGLSFRQHSIAVSAYDSEITPKCSPLHRPPRCARHFKGS